jgi:succinate dehydrogenase/fumarate reductase-like Fe-S protein
MGVSMLKRKRELNYRRGSTMRNCGTCDHHVPDALELKAGGVVVGSEDRCSVIGVKPGRTYRVLRNYICDAHDGTERLKKLRGW